MGYDIKFKRRVIEYKNEGHTYKETCKIFKISEMTLTRWDNATFHRENKLYDLCKNANKNLRLIFLPPYSPELNPIDNYWALLKRKIKKFDKNDKCFKDSIYKLF